MAAGSFTLPQIGVAEEWQRPLDWLPIDHLVTASEQKIVILAAVFPNANNYFAISLTTTGNWTMTVSDGTSVSIGSGGKLEKSLNYNDFPDSTITKNGYKQAIITITPNAGVNLLNVSFNQRITGVSSAYSTTFLDMVISLPNANSTSSSPIIFSAGTTGQKNLMLKKVKILSIGTSTNLVEIFRGVIGIEIIDMNNCVGSVIDFTNFALSCYSLKKVKNFNANSATNITQIFGDCFGLIEFPLITSNSITNMNSFSYGCYSLKKLPAINCNNISGAAFFNINLLESLEWCDMYNIAENANFSASKLLSRSALVNIFNKLSTVTGKTINITGCLGASSLTTAERAIATGKGWTITG